MIEEYVKELVENTPEKENIMVTISVTRPLLARINKLRIQRKMNREPQFKCLERIVKFYEENHGT